jgi:hypothetical protein
MSRPPPPKLDGGSVSVRFVLTAGQVADIEAACGVQLTDRARADLGEVLDWYLLNAAAKDEAPTIEAAEKRLDKLHELAAELHDLTGVHCDDAVERNLRSRLHVDLNWNNSASALHVVLGAFLKVLPPVRESLAHRREWPEFDLPRQLASDLDIIWRHHLENDRTIGPGSPFVRFVQATTACLPSHWPWRPAGRLDPQSPEAFARAIDRSLDRPLDR